MKIARQERTDPKTKNTYKQDYSMTTTYNHNNTIPYLLELAYTNWDNAELLGKIGVEMEARTRLDIARRVLERALFLNPLHHPEWYLSFAFAHFRDTTGNFSGDGEKILIDGIEETNSDYLKASYLSLFEGNSEELAELIEDLRSSEDLSVRFALGHSLLWRGDTDDACSLLRATIAEIDENAVPLGLEAYCGAMNWMRGQGMAIDLEHEVLSHLQRAIHSSPDVYNYRALQIQAFQTLRDYKRVAEAAHETLLHFPDEETTMFALATAYEKLDNQTNALLWYNRAIGAKPSYARARVMLGKLYEQRGELDAAESVFRDIGIANPSYNMGKLEIAYFLKRIGKEKEAVALFRYAYDRLKTFEKASVEQHPEGKIFVNAMLSLELPILMN
ncbi:MAG: hypothetical protein EAZ92_14305 [Candidatus Kapaibacterium sp.]|nr:MAG: hypothetical protein EAZ92_14305 [Candidatus Kapabacteria bacterium]